MRSTSGLFRLLFLLSLSFTAVASVIADAGKDKHAIKSYTTQKIISEAPVIDGRLDEPVWNQVPWGGDFVGHRPEYMAEPTQKTQFKILYDDKYLYIGIRSFDDDPSAIVKRMSRRDGFDGDFVEVNIDSYHDKRTAFSFTASASGVKSDEYVSNNGNNWDSTWDPIWYLETSVDDQGWVAEYKVPLSQLRFADREEHVWGFQITRRFFREGERSTWQPISPQANGWVHLFGELRGIKGIRPQKQLEIQPYVVGQLEKYPKEDEDPFRDTGTDTKGNLGVDAKIGLTSDITLDLTINPDFGQVEGDPSVVNLSAFEQFFRERRPFFLEGNNLFNFPTNGGRNNLFYSRRIGAPPHGRVTDDDVAYIDRSSNTRILNAAKLTGKNANGFSWGVLGSVTSRVDVVVQDTLGDRRKEKIEPYTTYTALRAQQDINEGQTVVGTFVTHMSRSGNRGNELELLHDMAQTGGVDIRHQILDRKYGFTFQFSGSRVAGTSDAITNTQESFARNYQRTDNDYRSVDTTLTVLSGTSSRLQFGKKSGNWVWEAGFNHRSPGFEVNDMGFVPRVDVMNTWLWSQYRVQTIKRWFRSQRYNFNIEQSHDFGGNRNYVGFGNWIGLELKNFWRINASYWIDAESVSNSNLRGGPAFKNPSGYNYEFRIRTNGQKMVSGYINPEFSQAFNGAYKRQELGAGIRLRPVDALAISIDPRFTISRNDLQYVSTLDVEGDPMYLLGTIDRRTYRMSLRANYNLTPNLTFELWAQPFLAVGEYSDFKEATNGTANAYSERFNRLDSRMRRPSASELATYVNSSSDFDTVDDFPEDAYGIFSQSTGEMIEHFNNPDFDVINFRSNLVMRWEYVPGSTLFLVWSSNSAFNETLADNDFKSLTGQLLDLEGSNTFVLKYTYRFIL